MRVSISYRKISYRTSPPCLEESQHQDKKTTSRTTESTSRTHTGFTHMGFRSHRIPPRRQDSVQHGPLRISHYLSSLLIISFFYICLHFSSPGLLGPWNKNRAISRPRDLFHWIRAEMSWQMLLQMIKVVEYESDNCFRLSKFVFFVVISDDYIMFYKPSVAKCAPAGFCSEKNMSPVFLNISFHDLMHFHRF